MPFRRDIPLRSSPKALNEVSNITLKIRREAICGDIFRSLSLFRISAEQGVICFRAPSRLLLLIRYTVLAYKTAGGGTLVVPLIHTVHVML